MNAKHDVLWFVSDVHLVDGDQDYLDDFLRFLEAARQQAQALYIFGDLFEFWIGDRQGRTEFYQPLFASFRHLVDEGTAVKLIHGNRDFMMGSIFAAAGVEILPEEIVLELAGDQVHLSHGDQFCIHDHSYQRARVFFRSRFIRFISRLLPAWLGGFLARAYRGISERKKLQKKACTGNRFHTIEDGLRQEVERSDHDVIICGHIHYFSETPFEVAGRKRRVLTTGAWEEEGPNYITYANGRLDLQRFNPQAQI